MTSAPWLVEVKQSGHAQELLSKSGSYVRLCIASIALLILSTVVVLAVAAAMGTSAGSSTDQSGTAATTMGIIRILFGLMIMGVNIGAVVFAVLALIKAMALDSALRFHAGGQSPSRELLDLSTELKTMKICLGFNVAVYLLSAIIFFVLPQVSLALTIVTIVCFCMVVRGRRRIATMLNL